MSNMIQPELMAATSDDKIPAFDNEDVANQPSNVELGIGAAARFHLRKV